MNSIFIVGKFAPLHLGHVHLIQSALARADRVYVLTYCCPDFGFSSAQRTGWIQQQFEQPVAQGQLVVQGMESGVHCPLWKQLDDPCVQALAKQMPQAVVQKLHQCIGDQQVPHNDDDERLHRLWCAMLWKPHADASGTIGVMGSETYIEPFADCLSAIWQRQVQPIVLDVARREVPISATALRQARRIQGAAQSTYGALQAQGWQ